MVIAQASAISRANPGISSAGGALAGGPLPSTPLGGATDVAPTGDVGTDTGTGEVAPSDDTGGTTDQAAAQPVDAAQTSSDRGPVAGLPVELWMILAALAVSTAAGAGLRRVAAGVFEGKAATVCPLEDAK